jgi:hypothetical protein
LGTTQPGNQSLYARPVSSGTNLTLSTVIKEGTVDSLFVNGELALSASGKLPQLAGCGDTGALGRGYNDNTFYAGEIAEVAVYDRAVTDSERRAIEQYLGEKYGFLPPTAALDLTPTQR